VNHRGIRCLLESSVASGAVAFSVFRQERRVPRPAVTLVFDLVPAWWGNVGRVFPLCRAESSGHRLCQPVFDVCLPVHVTVEEEPQPTYRLCLDVKFAANPVPVELPFLCFGRPSRPLIGEEPSHLCLVLVHPEADLKEGVPDSV
jgi:hypothetical protein